MRNRDLKVGKKFIIIIKELSYSLYKTHTNRLVYMYIYIVGEGILASCLVFKDWYASIYQICGHTPLNMHKKVHFILANNSLNCHTKNTPYKHIIVSLLTCKN